jgi:hypothetical protein
MLRRHANANLLEALSALWDAVPYQRFGQLVMNLSREPGGFSDTWEWSHTDWRERTEKAYKEWTTEPADRTGHDSSAGRIGDSIEDVTPIGTVPAYHGKEKLEALAERVWAHGEIDDLDARSILAYIDYLESKVRCA